MLGNPPRRPVTGAQTAAVGGQEKSPENEVGRGDVIRSQEDFTASVRGYPVTSGNGHFQIVGG